MKSSYRLTIIIFTSQNKNMLDQKANHLHLQSTIFVNLNESKTAKHFQCEDRWRSSKHASTHPCRFLITSQKTHHLPPWRYTRVWPLDSIVFRNARSFCGGKFFPASGIGILRKTPTELTLRVSKTANDRDMADSITIQVAYCQYSSVYHTMQLKIWKM